MQVYEDNLEKGEFRIQQCKDCGKHVFYPRQLCHYCGSSNLKWVAISGRGTVYSTSVVRRKPERGGDYNVALIDLEEGPRMMSRVMDVEPEEVAIGMAVSAHVGIIDETPAVVFYNKEQGDKAW
ncbi:MAG: Zn-ribbon domain-containing OB-fold protein [Gammaproteobacteria bacterium]|nr:Zn-ribbon domain-containing OB-fold protein [Gammaproteobacteria bacterium]